MAQYKIGTVGVTNGSATVTAVDPDVGNSVLAETLWLTEVTAGDLFYVDGDAVAYSVQSINSDTELVLSSTYQGTTVIPAGSPLLVGAVYAVHRKFSTNYNMPLASQGDIGLPVFIELATIIMDTELQALDDRVVALEP